MAALIPEMPALQQAMGPMVEEAPAEPMEGQQPIVPPAAPMQPISVGIQLFSALQPPFNPREQGLMEAADYLSTWFTTDEGLNAPAELIEAVGVYQDACLQGQALRQTALGALSMAGAPPPVEDGKLGNKDKQSPPPGPQAQGGALAAGAG